MTHNLKVLGSNPGRPTIKIIGGGIAIDDVKWRHRLQCARQLAQVKEAKDIYDTLTELYPGKHLRIAMILGTRDKILGDKEKRLLREFYSSKM